MKSLVFACASVLLITSSAYADPCLDATERARQLLQQKKLTRARNELRSCAADACEEAIRSVCADRLAEVAERLPTIVLAFKRADGADLVGVETSIDGAPIRSADGNEIALDPGPHTFDFSAAGLSEQRTYVLLERQKGRLETVVFAAPPVVAAPSQDSPRVPPPQKKKWPLLGYGLLSAGAVGLGIGTAFGIDAIRQNDASGCNAKNVCADPRARHDARISANVSTAAFVAGGVAVVAGAFSLFVFETTW